MATFPLTRPAARAGWPKFLSFFAVIQGIWLVCYALLGKGFACMGFAPVYAGEILLVAGLAALAVSRRFASLLRTPLGAIMIVFLAWQLLCSAPHLETYGIDTLRDSVLWVYAAFGWITAALVLRLRGFLPVVLRRFRNFGRWYLVLGPAAWLATIYLGDWLPVWPGTNVSIPYIKGGEYCVHLAGVLAFISTGLGGVSQWALFLVLAEALLGMSVRGGILAFIAASAFAILLRPRIDRLAVIFGSLLLLVLTMDAFELKMVAPRATREFSLNQLSNSVISMVGDSGRSELENTKTWRLNWWSKIWDYTVDGPYVWTGKGYGINLADSDGFQVGTREDPLRSPHNSHLTFLARSGVPGFALWIALQLTWAGMIFHSYWRACRLHADEWSAFFIWVLAYWLAFMVAAGFDVFLEGPMAGIPFWALFGLGWGSITLFRSKVENVAPSGSRQMEVVMHAHG
jgi:hypothetical protein